MADIDPEEEEELAEPVEESEDNRKLLLALFILLLKDTQSHLVASVTGYLHGQVSIHSLQRTLTDSLLGAHTQAAYLGRRLAGVSAPQGEVDAAFARAVMQEQAGYLAGLIVALSTGKYPLGEDGSLPKALIARLRLYRNGLRNTADEAWTRALPDGTLIEWVTTAHESCNGCLSQEAANPHRASEMSEFPGDASNECGANCRCYLQIVGGGGGFTLDS